MPGLIIWKDQYMNRLRKDMDRMIDKLWGEFGLPQDRPIFMGMPFIDLTETDRNLILMAEIPGMNPKDFEISIVDDKLTIKGEIKQEVFKGTSNYHRTERRYGSFSRTFQLPCRIMIDDVKATYKKGILEIIMPKCAPEPVRAVKVVPA